MSKDVLFVSCTRGRKEDTALFKSLTRLGNLRAEMLFFENNTEGLAARYNSILDRADMRDKLIVLAHDDLVIFDPLLIKRLNDAPSAIIGLVGSDAFWVDATTPFLMWTLAGKPHLSGEIILGPPERSLPNYYGDAPRPVVVIDGLFIAVRPALLKGVRFDAGFSFNFYDLDFCLTAIDAGVDIWTTAPIACRHLTHYDVDTNNRPFMDAQQIFRAKWLGWSKQLTPVAVVD